MGSDWAVVAVNVFITEPDVVVSHLSGDVSQWAEVLHRAQAAFGEDWTCGIYSRQQVEQVLGLDW